MLGGAALSLWTFRKVHNSTLYTVFMTFEILLKTTPAKVLFKSVSINYDLN